MNRTASYGSFMSTESDGAIQPVPDACCAGAQPMLQAASARCPASPRSSQSIDAAIVRSSWLERCRRRPIPLLEILGRPRQRLVEMTEVAGVRPAGLVRSRPPWDC